MEELCKKLEKQDLIQIIKELASSSPLNTSFFYSLVNSEEEEILEANIFDELDQLKICFDDRRKYDIWAGVLIQEKLHYIFRITEEMKRHQRYAGIGRIYKEISLLMIHFLNNSTEMDYETEQHMNQLLKDLSEWESEDIPHDDMLILQEIFNDEEFFSQLDDFNYSEDFRNAISQWYDTGL
jgi:REP element-mobilizing transposase RayT